MRHSVTASLNRVLAVSGTFLSINYIFAFIMALKHPFNTQQESAAKKTRKIVTIETKLEIMTGEKGQWY